jgi:hypothetical protein
MGATLMMCLMRVEPSGSREASRKGGVWRVGFPSSLGIGACSIRTRGGGACSRAEKRHMPIGVLCCAGASSPPGSRPASERVLIPHCVGWWSLGEASSPPAPLPAGRRGETRRGATVAWRHGTEPVDDQGASPAWYDAWYEGRGAPHPPPPSRPLLFAPPRARGGAGVRAHRYIPLPYDEHLTFWLGPNQA